VALERGLVNRVTETTHTEKASLETEIGIAAHRVRRDKEIDGQEQFS
jgi:hypothetical protein